MICALCTEYYIIVSKQTIKYIANVLDLIFHY